MAGTGVISYGSHDQAPYYPVVCILWILLYALLYFLDSLGHLTLFKESKGPMSVTVVVVRIVQLGTPTNIYCLLVELMHVVQEG